MDRAAVILEAHACVWALRQIVAALESTGSPEARLGANVTDLSARVARLAEAEQEWVVRHSLGELTS